MSNNMQLDTMYKIVEEKIKLDLKRNLTNGIKKEDNIKYLHDTIDNLIEKGILIGDNFNLLIRLENYIKELYKIESQSDFIEKLSNELKISSKEIESFLNRLM